MDPVITSALISGASSLAGSLLGNKNNHAGRDQRQAIEFANRSSVLDKVAAAKEAGISPLYALGAPTISTTSQVGSSDTLGSTLASMGQDVSRAVAAGQSATERQLTALTLEKAGLENEYLRSQIASVNSRTARESAPAIPLENVQPPQRTPHVQIGGRRVPFANVSDVGQIIEDRYGEDNPVTWPIGAAMLAADTRAIIQDALVRGFGDNPSEQNALRKMYDYLAR